MFHLDEEHIISIENTQSRSDVFSSFYMLAWIYTMQGQGNITITWLISRVHTCIKK